MPRTKKTDSEVVEKKTTTRKPRAKKASTSKASKLDFKKYYESIRANVAANKKKYSRFLIVLGVVLLLGVFVFLKKDWFVIAMVNREPITTVEFYQNLKARNGQEVLTQIIRDKLINQEANKQGVTVNPAQIDEKIKEIEDQLGGKEQLDEALAQASTSQEDFRKQVRIQLIVEKILEDKIEVSDEEIDAYIKENPDDPNVSGSADDSGPDREAIRKQLRSNKLNEEFTTWYQELEDKSSIVTFL